jgi:RNA polymerase sigma-70 factor (ECF subfamily)
MTGTEVIDKIKNKDDASFRQVVDLYQPYILRLCYRFVNNKETAEDLTQEVFIQIYKSLDDFKKEAKLSTWIYRIASAKSLDYLKAAGRKKRFAAVKSLLSLNKDDLYKNSGSISNPHREMENTDRAEILFAALESLSSSQRAAFTLSKCEGLNNKEIAEILGISISAVESLVHRAKENLKKKLYKYYKEII